MNLAARSSMCSVVCGDDSHSYKEHLYSLYNYKIGTYLLYSFTLDKVLMLQNYSERWGLDFRSLSNGAKLKDIKLVALNESCPELSTTQHYLPHSQL